MSKIILIGSPNSGKSLLFNRLTGLHQKVANFPGVTVDVGSGAIPEIPGTTLVDFPGTYSLQPISGEERVATRYGPKGDILVKTQTRLDSLFLHSALGGVAFLVIMYLLFQSIFTWAAPVMDAVEYLLGGLSDLVVPAIGFKIVQDFTADAIFSGIGAFLVFVPQIFVLTLVIGILEDSGYMARAALICHKPLRFFGLTGKSFIPMLSGVACAIPGIYAARAIESPKKRLLTYMAIPLMPCSARLPVYTLLMRPSSHRPPHLAACSGCRGWPCSACTCSGCCAVCW